MSRQVVEIVGVAGAGKSTLASCLSTMDAGRRLAPFLDAGRISHLPYVVTSLPAVASVLLRAAVRRPRLSWREFKLMVYVAAWPRYLQRNWQKFQTAFLLDQGPVYAMGRLVALGKPFTQSRAFDRWRHRMTATWATVLTDLVVLDASNETLLARIGSRERAHETKGLSPETGHEFLRRHRLAFELVMAELAALGGPRAVKIDTARQSADQVAVLVASRIFGASRGD